MLSREALFHRGSSSTSVMRHSTSQVGVGSGFTAGFQLPLLLAAASACLASASPSEKWDDKDALLAVCHEDQRAEPEPGCWCTVTR